MSSEINFAALYLFPDFLYGSINNFTWVFGRILSGSMLLLVKADSWKKIVSLVLVTMKPNLFPLFFPEIKAVMVPGVQSEFG